MCHCGLLQVLSCATFNKIGNIINLANSALMGKQFILAISVKEVNEFRCEVQKNHYNYVAYIRQCMSTAKVIEIFLIFNLLVSGVRVLIILSEFLLSPLFNI